MRQAVLAVILIPLVGLSAAERLNIHLSAPILDAGHSEEVVCRVPSDTRNRWLELGIDNYASSGVQLEGEDAAISHRMLFKSLPCGVTGAYCHMSRNDGSSDTVHAQIIVSGCDGL